MTGALYARKSSEQRGVSDEAKSVSRQIAHGRAFAVQRGWSVPDECVFDDDGVSGAEFERRPGLVRLLEALEPRPRFQVLIVSSMDRLGREQFETNYLLKRITTAGVRVFSYLEDREYVFDSPTDKMVLSVTSFSAEHERHQARQRTRDALLSRAAKGYVTGGSVFGFQNVDVRDETGKRQYVDRRIDTDQAAIVVRIFDMAAAGMGQKRTTKILNAEAVPSPHPRRKGRLRSWTPSSIRAILFNPLYTGRMVWGRTRKRDKWGRKKQSRCPESAWVRAPIREDLRIISDQLWDAAHARIAATREAYRAAGRLQGRPPGGTESKYLLTAIAECATCGGSMVAASRASGRGRKPAYVCANHRERGNTICANRLHAPMEAADRAVLGAIESDLLRPEVVEEALREAIRQRELSEDEAVTRREHLEGELHRIDGELAHYAEAIATAGQLEAILAAMTARESRKTHLRAELEKLTGRAKAASLDATRLRLSLRERLTDWQGLLRRQPTEARQILRKLLTGRLVFTSREDANGPYYEFVGKGSISEIVSGVVLPKDWWPQRDSDPCFSLERAVSWASRRWGRVAAAGLWLGEEDSNPRYVVQSHASYH